MARWPGEPTFLQAGGVRHEHVSRAPRARIEGHGDPRRLCPAWGEARPGAKRRGNPVGHERTDGGVVKPGMRSRGDRIPGVIPPARSAGGWILDAGHPDEIYLQRNL